MKKIHLKLSIILLLTCCSPVMEANRPDPVDLSQFVIGEHRMKIVAEIGAPVSTIKDGDNSCDIYKLYTSGPGGAGKGAIAAGEVVADVFTLGLAEIILTPTEAATQNAKHTVIFCYDKTDGLVATNLSDTAVND